VHGAATYGRDIVFSALRDSGHEQFNEPNRPELSEEEWRDNLRVRDEYNFNGGEFRAAPGLWLRSDRGPNQAIPNWKNPQFTRTPSTCDVTWSEMRRLCACTPPTAT
jgi:hypothetical protein